MEIETVFLSCFAIEKKQDDIFTLIEAALQVGASKYPAQFEKRNNRIIKFLIDPVVALDNCILDDKVEEVSVGDEED
ncbi:hypothetical protein RDI58_001902 [Solanum bulbocastanum]|uniref:Uncharacterized protein n=1 Tax=Solanum bulbocastanum TaxID=147425 RepID=A0AAN8YNJ0_SOLBU